MKKAIALIAVLLGVAVTAGHAATAKENWDATCAKCHGADGKGNTKMGQKVGVKDYTDPKVQASFTDDQAFKAIKEGLTVDGKEKMKPYSDKFKDQEIKDLVTYLRTFKKAQ